MSYPAPIQSILSGVQYTRYIELTGIQTTIWHNMSDSDCTMCSAHAWYTSRDNYHQPAYINLIPHEFTLEACLDVPRLYPGSVPRCTSIIPWMLAWQTDTCVPGTHHMCCIPGHSSTPHQTWECITCLWSLIGIYTHTYIYIYMCVCVYVYVCINVYKYVYTHVICNAVIDECVGCVWFWFCVAL